MIRRGTNECGIEEEVVAGLPSPRSLINEYGRMDKLRDASMWDQKTSILDSINAVVKMDMYISSKFVLNATRITN